MMSLIVNYFLYFNTYFYSYFSALNVLDGKENLNLAKYGLSISNPNEAELVATIVQFLIKITSSPVRKKTIGVVTYSLKQKKDIQARLQR